MFAIALWDDTRRRLVLVRDRLGKKPLKYVELDGALLFGSEIKALLASGMIAPDVKGRDVLSYLSLGFVPAPGTGMIGVHKLPPAHMLVRENGRTHVTRYWQIDFRCKAERSIEEWKEVVRGEVRAAVRRRLVSDVPLGAFLSGGIDSSIVVACMAEASSRVETFSIGFEHEAYDERQHARVVAQAFGTSHHEFVVRAEVAEMLPTLAVAFDEPYADSSALPSWFLARETRRHVTVALNGDGGDEGFAGYSRYARLCGRDRLARWIRPLGLRSLTGAASRADGWLPPRTRRLLEGLHGLLAPGFGERYAWTVSLFSGLELAALVHGIDANSGPDSDIVAAAANAPEAGVHPVDRMLFADTSVYLPGDLLVKMDIATMSHSLEARSPLLDHRVLELAASVPADLKLHRGHLKWLLKESFRGVLPASILDRKKQGFAIPLDDWFRGPLRQVAGDLLATGEPRIGAFVRREVVRMMLDDHWAGRGNHGRQIWALVMLELWWRWLEDNRSAGLANAGVSLVPARN
jgi:asparagine synthase (glutamine-hydrolysing)